MPEDRAITSSKSSVDPCRYDINFTATCGQTDGQLEISFPFENKTSCVHYATVHFECPHKIFGTEIVDKDLRRVVSDLQYKVMNCSSVDKLF